MNKNIRGCLKSHCSVLLQAWASNSEYCLTLEDDVEFLKSTDKTLKDILTNKYNWDVCQLSSIIWFDSENANEKRKDFLIKTAISNGTNFVQLSGSGAHSYVTRKSSYEKLINIFSHRLEPADDCLQRVLCVNYIPMCITVKEFSSDTNSDTTVDDIIRRKRNIERYT